MVAVSCVVFDRRPEAGAAEARVLFVQRAKEPAKGVWALVGGRVHLGERVADAAVREVKEETGLDVEVLHFLLSVAFNVP
eukprot:tig00001030_g6456.t1